MNTRKISVFIILILLVMGINSACGLAILPAATPTPTNTPLPTASNTPLPTATNTPTSIPTDTLTPTATPDLQATQAAQNEQTVRLMLTELDLTADSGHMGWYQEKSISIPLQGPSFNLKTFDNKFTAADFVLYSEVTWKTDSWPMCGLLFRSDDRFDKGNFYSLQFLRFSGLPAWDIEYFHDGLFVTGISPDVQFSDYLKIDDGATNKIVLAANGNEFKVYDNGNYEGQYYDWSKKLAQGNIAFYASQNAGSTKCIFDKSWIWAYK
jgi:hypothetical protein